MALKVACICLSLMLCVWSSSAVPVVELRPTHLQGEPVDRVVVVKRSAQYDRPGGGIPCGFSAYRCPHPDLPALCRSYEIPICHGTDFISVNIGH